MPHVLPVRKQGEAGNADLAVIFPRFRFVVQQGRHRILLIAARAVKNSGRLGGRDPDQQSGKNSSRFHVKPPALHRDSPIIVQ